MSDRPATLMPPLFQDASPETLAVRARIDALNADYAAAIDADRLEEWPSFFTADGLYRVITRENVDMGLEIALIYARGHGMLADRITALRTANIYEPHTYCHTSGALRLLGRTERGWRAESNFSIVRTMASGPTGHFVSGRYLDLIAETPDGLRYAERIAVLDSRSIDTLLVIPV